MAGLGDDGGLDGYMFPTYGPYAFPCAPGPKGKGGGGGWRPRGAAGASSGLPAFGQPPAADYLDSYQRAQLMAVLAQVSPGLVPRLRRAPSRDVAVQVNPRRDAAVQCSLGRRPLLRRARELPEAAFPRTAAVYSPVASRRLAALVEEPEGGEAPEGGGGGGRGSAAEEPAQADGAQAAERADEPEELEPEREHEQERAAAGKAEAAGETAAAGSQSPEQTKTRLRFQFLEQKYGYYHCKDCNIRWESAYVWCVQGTNKVYFKQFCRTCEKSYNPYRVEDIACQSCKQTRCSCAVKLRHVDPKRPHRQDLCGRCKGKRLSCDSTFSFKYII
ncbi:zygote arrest protein 1 [Sarcophilus harrisii]|uniref:Zygote arrest 1 n=1 Tax=Sarcophilus harrisii TaxID=9305 RepID=A0A7N4PCL8_SARHA|nr:zygote arrest protein 1 [Sarcophilus harrisii]